jgi:hypothetical protein
LVPQPEQEARKAIDELLAKAGWFVCDADNADVHGSTNVAGGRKPGATNIHAAQDCPFGDSALPVRRSSTHAENAVQGCTNAASAGCTGAAIIEIVREDKSARQPIWARKVRPKGGGTGMYRRQFGKGNDFAQKITYRTTGVSPKVLINEFRTSPMPRIAVTVGEAEKGEHPVDVCPAERARHGWRTLGFRAERDARAKKVIATGLIRHSLGTKCLVFS